MKIRNGNPLNNTQLNPMQGSVFSQFMQNPLQWLMQKKINIPSEYANNPQGAIQYLLNNGQMTQEQLNTLTQKANQLGFKL